MAVPAEATIRRTLARLDADALAGTIGAWLADPDRRNAAPGRRAVAVDGKTLPGARTQAVMPAAAPAGGDDPPAAGCWPNARSPARRGGPALAPLLADLDLDGVVVTADALQSHAEAAEFLVRDKQATTCWWSRPTNQPCRPLPAPAMASRATRRPHP